MKSLALIEKLFPCLVLGLLIGAVGCGTKTTASSEPGDIGAQEASVAQDSSVVASATGTSSAPVALTARSLAGVWLGKAVLDARKLEQRVSQLDPENQKVASAKAKSFLSTVMAMEFRENGTLESEVELISTQGQILRDGSLASWRVLDAKPNGLLVQIQERLADGTIASDQHFYQFSADRNQIAFRVPVSPELRDCDAMVVFERKTLPPTNVATGPKATLTK